MVIDYQLSDDIATVTLNRPDVYNTVNQDLSDRFVAAVERAGREARCLIVTGAGRAFSAGADLRSLMAEYERGEGDLASVTRRRFNPMVRALAEAELPTVAAINGPAAGAGMGFALACDIRVMASESYLMSAFLNVALAPDSGTTWFLPRMVGLSKAIEIAYSARKVPADEALELGLAHEVVAPADLPTAARRWAQRLADGPTEALVMTRKLFHGEGTLDEALVAEDAAQGYLGARPAFMEGALAFIQKRPPKFRSVDG